MNKIKELYYKIFMYQYYRCIECDRMFLTKDTVAWVLNGETCGICNECEHPKQEEVIATEDDEDINFDYYDEDEYEEDEEIF